MHMKWKLWRLNNLFWILVRGGSASACPVVLECQSAGASVCKAFGAGLQRRDKQQVDQGRLEAVAPQQLSGT
eukprot:1159221-Pelagomonas_calceolata.AAC.14